MTEDVRDGLRRELRSQHVSYWLRVKGQRIASVVKAVAVVAGVALVVAVEVSWLEEPLRRIGFQDLDGIGAAVIVFILALMFFDMRGLAARQSANVDRHFSDPMAVYPVLIKRIQGTKRRSDKVLDVLGMTLYTAWPTVTFWLNHPELNGWTIRLCAMVDDEGQLRNFVPPEWSSESRSNLENAAVRARTLATTGRNIEIETYAYDFIPVIHGFRLGNGDIFYSILSWQLDGRIGRESYSYQYVPCDDSSAAAIAIREVFDSWFKRARFRPWNGAGAESSATDTPDGQPVNAPGRTR